MNISILGAGTWSCALAVLLTDNGHHVRMWSESQEKADKMRDTRSYPLLPGVIFPEDMEYTTDYEEAIADAPVIIMGVASPYVRSVARGIAPFYKEEQIIVSVAKGIEEDSLMLLHEQIADEIKGAKVAVLSGPSHAEEVSRRIPTTCVIGAADEETANMLQGLFMSQVFRVYTSSDIEGIELCGALKNVIALAAGMADGLGYGDNTKAALITRGLSELTRLGVAMGAKPETTYGLAGIGDLIVTCASMHSRNRRAGILIGQGKSLDEAIEEVGMVVEGVYSAKAARALSEKYGVDMPIVAEVSRILFEGKAPADAIKDLMLRERRVENKNLKWG